MFGGIPFSNLWGSVIVGPFIFPDCVDWLIQVQFTMIVNLHSTIKSSSVCFNKIYRFLQPNQTLDLSHKQPKRSEGALILVSDYKM